MRLKSLYSSLQRLLNLVTNKRAKKETMTESNAFPQGEKRVLESCSGEVDTKKQKVDNSETCNEITKKIFHKKKFALLFMYSGKGYLGLQLQKSHDNTVENEILTALLKAELITQEDFDSPSSIQWQRAARTDKNVSAAGNLLSFKHMVVVENPVERINSFLPKHIQAIDAIRVTQGFNSKNYCDNRTYSYLLPTFALTGKNEPLSTDYRISDNTLQRVRSVLKKFEGTHNYHNFTLGIMPHEMRAKRYIIHFNCSDPFIQEGLEFLHLNVKGQSFMRHQIRKMVGLMITIVSAMQDEEYFDKAFSNLKYDIPKVPGNGLMLEMPHFEQYNKRYGTGGQGSHTHLDWSNYKEKMEAFKKECIYSDMIKAEKEENITLDWLETIRSCHAFDCSDPYKDRNKPTEKAGDDNSGDESTYS